MTDTRKIRRVAGGMAATAVGLSVVASPATAAAADITIDLNTVSSAVEDANFSEDASSASDLVSGLYEVSRAVEVNGTTVDESLGLVSPAEPTDPTTSNPATNPSTVADPTAEGIEDLGTENSGLEDEIGALNLANESPADVGETADGREVHFPTKGRFTSGFGSRWGTVHEGIDVANSVGTPIRAVMDGTVVAAGPASGFGNWVVIQHDGGEKSVYGHMTSWDVSVGQRVTAGEKIAEIGNAGRSTGPHLHFEIRPDGQTAVDPVTWFATQGISVSDARQ